MKLASAQVSLRLVVCPLRAVSPNLLPADDVVTETLARFDLTCRPEIRRDYPLNLSISLSGGKETNKDSPSNGE